MEAVENAVKNIESKLGISSGFFDDLQNEDDWSFVIKSHALIESSCSELLTVYFGQPSLDNIFSRLELGEKYTGKIAFLSSLELLMPNERKYIQEFSLLRNRLVHNSRNLNFSFSKYIAGMDKNQKNTFASAFLIDAEFSSDLKSEVLSNPKYVIWKNLKYLIAIISLQIDLYVAKNKTLKLKEEIEKAGNET